MNEPEDDDVFILILPKSNGERFCIMYDRSSLALALRQLGRWASNPELSFTWYDAAVMSQKIMIQASR